MAVTYPLTLPTTIGLESVQIRSVNAVSTSRSPFSHKQQIISHPGQSWEATLTIPPVARDKAAEWKAFLVSLKGQVGTFLLSDPDYDTPRGTVSSCTLSGTAGEEEASVTMTGTLLAGDYIQVGAGSTAKLHQVLSDQSGSGTIDIWPALRDTYSSTAVLFSPARGVFRLASNITSWDINNVGTYGISFDCIEAIT